MNWITLYIKGRTDFREDVRRKLANSKLDIMPGYVDSSTGEGAFDLYWVDESVPLRKIKETIGGKLIWKYRLQFYPNLEDFIESVSNMNTSLEFTKEEESMMDAMRKNA